MLAALVELLFFFFPPFFSSFLFPSCGLFVSRKCGAALEIPSRAEKHRNFCRRRRRRRRYRRSEFNYALIILPIERDVFIDPSPHFSFIDDFFFFDTTKKEKSTSSLLLFRYIYVYIYIRRITDGNPASREPFWTKEGDCSDSRAFGWIAWNLRDAPDVPLSAWRQPVRGLSRPMHRYFDFETFEFKSFLSRKFLPPISSSIRSRTRIDLVEREAEQRTRRKRSVESLRRNASP